MAVRVPPRCCWSCLVLCPPGLAMAHRAQIPGWCALCGLLGRAEAVVPGCGDPPSDHVRAGAQHPVRGESRASCLSGHLVCVGAGCCWWARAQGIRRLGVLPLVTCPADQFAGCGKEGGAGVLGCRQGACQCAQQQVVGGPARSRGRWRLGRRPRPCGGGTGRATGAPASSAG